MLKDMGYQTFNYALHSAYSGSNRKEMTPILSKLKTSEVASGVIINPATGDIKVSLLAKSSALKTGTGKNSNGTVHYLAAALIEPVRAIEVRQHQTLNNTQVVDVLFKVVRVSPAGKAIGLRKGTTGTWSMNFVPTSNGWKPDIETRGNQEVTKYARSSWGSSTHKKYIRYLGDKEFAKNLESNIIGEWVLKVKNPNKVATYEFNEDGSFTYSSVKKGLELEGKYNLDRITPEGQRVVILVPKSGRNKFIYVRRGNPGQLFIQRKALAGEGVYVNSNPSVDESDGDVDEEAVLDAKIKRIKTRLIGFWKSSNGKKSFDFHSESTVTYVSKQVTVEETSYMLVPDNGKIFLVVLSEGNAEVLRTEITAMNLKKLTTKSGEFFKL